MTGPSWQPDETALAGVEHLDGDYVATYDTKTGVTGQPPDLARLVELGLGPSSTLVDLGAGTGLLALAAASVCATTVAVDVSPAMVAELRRRSEQHGVRNLRVVQAGFLSYEHTGPPVDVVYSRHALHQLPDAWKALALCRIADMLAPGGLLFLRDLVYCFEPSELTERLEAWFSGAVASAAEGWTRDELETHVRTEHSTYSWLLHELIEHAGLTVEVFEPSAYPSTYAAYVCRKPQ